MEKYKSIADALRKRIHDGLYQPGEMLPDQNQLAKEFDTARVTIQKTMKLLIREGLIYSKRGSGTYVKKNVITSDKTLYSKGVLGTSKRIAENQNIETKIISYNVRFPNEKESESLMIGLESPIYDIVRLRIVDTVPLKLEHTLIPVEIIPSLNRDILENSIYEYFQKELQLTFGSVDRVVRAAKSTKMDIEYLESKSKDPILEVEQIVYLENGTPIEYSTSRSRYDKVEFTLRNMSIEE